jgi:hypothetical protein
MTLFVDFETIGSSEPLTIETSSEYWAAFLSGGVLDAVAYDYGTFVLTETFSGSLHMCVGRVAVLDGEPSGIGEWDVQSTQPRGGSSSPGAKVFTLTRNHTFRTLVLGVTADTPVLMGRDEEHRVHWSYANRMSAGRRRGELAPVSEAYATEATSFPERSHRSRGAGIAHVRRRIKIPLYIVTLNLIHDPHISFCSARLFQQDQPSTAGLR